MKVYVLTVVYNDPALVDNVTAEVFDSEEGAIKYALRCIRSAMRSHDSCFPATVEEIEEELKCGYFELDLYNNCAPAAFYRITEKTLKREKRRKRV